MDRHPRPLLGCRPQKCATKGCRRKASFGGDGIHCMHCNDALRHAPKHLTFDILNSRNQERAKAMFLNAGPNDGCWYELNLTGDVLSRRRIPQ